MPVLYNNPNGRIVSSMQKVLIKEIANSLSITHIERHDDVADPYYLVSFVIDGGSGHVKWSID